MEILVRLCIGIGILVMLTGAVWHTIEIFRFSTKWGLLCTLVPFVYLVFLLKYFEVVRKAFYTELAGLGLLVLGMILHSVYG